MDFATAMPLSTRGNTVLCVWICWFSGFVICEALPDRKAQTVAEAYERCVFRRFGASVIVRHDRDTAFMSEVFDAFNDLLNQRQLPTFAYRPQANGTTERMIQTVIRAVKKYSTLEGHKDWDILAERLSLAINTSFDTVRKNTPFFLVHGWDPLTTLQATMVAPLADTSDAQDAWLWRQQLHTDYQFCLRLASNCLDLAKQQRAETHNNQVVTDERIHPGDAVWLYIDQVKQGYKKKLCHLWHGPFRVLNKRNAFSSVLDLELLLPSKRSKARATRRFHPEVHDSRLMLFRQTPERPAHAVNSDLPPVNFDATSFLPDASYEPHLHLTAVLDTRATISTHGRAVREYLVRTADRPESHWMRDSELPRSPLLTDFDRHRLCLTRFTPMLDASDPAPSDHTVESCTPDTQALPEPRASLHSTEHTGIPYRSPYQTPHTTNETIHDHQLPKCTDTAHLWTKPIAQLLQRRVILGTTFWYVQWQDIPTPSWHRQQSLIYVPSWKTALRHFETQDNTPSVFFLHHKLSPIPESLIE
jgi:hypothetical protein